MMFRPTTINAIFYRIVLESEYPFSSRHGHLATVRNCDETNSAMSNTVFLVVSLNLGRRPSDIPWLVVSIIVDPIERPSGPGYLADVSLEVREVLPSFANLDAAGAVPFVGMMVWIGAFVPHRKPSAIEP